MNETMTRRDWLNTGATILGGSILGSMAGVNPLNAAPTTNGPVRMMYNENPYGPSQIARRAMRKAFAESNLYSMDEAQIEFKNLIAKLNGVTPDHIALGFGSSEILKKAALMNGIEGGDLVSPSLTFETINRYAATMKSRIKRVPMDENIGINLDRMASAVDQNTKLVYLCNPNNPTGRLMDTSELESFCETVSEKALVFVDEAYHEYVMNPDYRSIIGLVKKGKNVIVSRTASKVHGLAGLRVGFAITMPELAKRLNAYLTNLQNIVGLRGAIASYKDQRFQNYSIEMNNRAKKIVTDFFDENGIRYLDSQTNFIFFKTGMEITKFQPAIAKQGVLVGRPFPPYTDWCRLSMAKPEEMERFIDGFKGVMR